MEIVFADSKLAAIETAEPGKSGLPVAVIQAARRKLTLMSDRNLIPVDHPGTFIVEELEARGWTQVDLAYILGITPQQLSPILNGKQGISPDMAVAFGDAFDVPADFFANLQKQYDLFKAKRPNAAVRARATWLNVFPLREMIKRGWIADSDDPSLLDLQMARFFNKNRVEDIPFIGDGDVLPHAARKSDYGFPDFTEDMAELRAVDMISNEPEDDEGVA